MTHLDVLATICELAESQGFYGRLRHDLHELHINSPEEYKELMRTWDERNFKDALDVVLYFEQ